MNGIRLTHCGIAVDHFRGKQALFADAQTDDALTHCQGCGKPLQACLDAGEMKLANGSVFTGKRRRATTPRPRDGVRDAAAAHVRKAVADIRERQQARAAA